MASLEKIRKKIKRKLRLDNKRLINSFKFAYAGIKEAYKGEQNLKIHTFIAILVLVFGFFLKISYMEWLICLVLIGIVILVHLIVNAIRLMFVSSILLFLSVFHNSYYI